MEVKSIFVRRIAYRYCDTYTGDQGVTFLPTLQKLRPRNFHSGVKTIFPTPKLKGYGSTTLPLRTLISIRNSGWRSIVVKRIGSHKKPRKREGNRIFWLTTGRKEYKRGKEWIVKVMVFLYSLLESPYSETDKLESESDCTVYKSPSMDPGGYPHQVWTWLWYHYVTPRSQGYGDVMATYIRIMFSNLMKFYMV